MVLLIVTMMMFREGPTTIGFGSRVALVRVRGSIMDSRRLVDEIQRWGRDGSVKAMVVRIDSPGGSAAASQEVFDELKKFRGDGKPVIASLGSVAASGGYYLACGADSIISNPGTITGSIGVIISFPQAKELLEKIGIELEIVKSGQFKDVGSYARELGDEERRLLQATVDDIHSQFIEVVSSERGLDIDRVRELAQGQIFSGREALEAGLVDKLGTLEDAISIAGLASGIGPDPEVVEILERRRFTLWDLVKGRIDEVTSGSGFGAYYVMPSGR
jgi:protease-4